MKGSTTAGTNMVDTDLASMGTPATNTAGTAALPDSAGMAGSAGRDLAGAGSAAVEVSAAGDPDAAGRRAVTSAHP